MLELVAAVWGGCSVQILKNAPILNIKQFQYVNFNGSSTEDGGLFWARKFIAKVNGLALESVGNGSEKTVQGV